MARPSPPADHPASGGVDGPLSIARGAAGHVNGGAQRAQGKGDAFADTSAGACDDGDFSTQLSHVLLLLLASCTFSPKALALSSRLASSFGR